MGYTLQQLQQMGAKIPSAPTSTPEDASANAYNKMVQNVQSGNLVAQPQQQGSSFLGNVIKDPINTLLVKPGTRIAQAGIGLTENSNLDQNIGKENTATNQAQALITQAQNEPDPQKHQALLDQAKQILQGNSSVNNAENNELGVMSNLDKPADVNLGGVNFNEPAQQGGKKGIQQIAGDALKDASYLGAPELADAFGLTDATTVAGRAIGGATTGGVAGATAGAGQALEDPNATPTSVGRSALEGAGAGVVLGGGVPLAIDGAQQGISAAQDAVDAPKTGGSDGDTHQTALDAISNPLSKDEQNSAVRRGQLSTSSKTGINNKVDYEPSTYDHTMAKTLEPMVNDGRIQPPTSITNQESNIVNTGSEISNQGDTLRAALKANDEANPNTVSWSDDDLKKVADDVHVPDPVKNEPTLARNVRSVKNAVAKLGQGVTKNSEGVLDVQQNFDSYIKKNYGENFFDKGRNADPFHQYVYSMRDNLTDFGASKLPDGKLPSGQTYSEARLTQHHLINAQDEMTAKFVREYPQGSTPASRFMDAHPILKKFGLRTAMQIAAAATGTTLAVGAIKKAVSSIGK